MRKARMAIVTAVALLIATPAFGQGIALGVKAGASFAKLGGDDVTDASNRTGLSIGAMAELGVSPMFSIQPELAFVQKGTSQSFEGESGSLDLTYIEIPVLAKITLPTPGPSRPYIYLGPSASFQTGCSMSGEGGGVSASIDCDNELFAELGIPAPDKSVDFGVVGGLGMGLGMGPGEASFDVRYNMGMSSVFDTPEGAETVDAKNRAFAVVVGYAIRLGM